MENNYVINIDWSRKNKKIIKYNWKSINNIYDNTFNVYICLVHCLFSFFKSRPPTKS